MLRSLSIACILCLLYPFGFAQKSLVTGYVFESGNRGFLNMVRVAIQDDSGKEWKAVTNLEGIFELELPGGISFSFSAEKELFHTKTGSFSTESEGEKTFLKIQLERKPGYLFEATMAPARSNEDIEVDAITGALIEIYNNTTGEQVLTLKDHSIHAFSYNLEQGNHYTIMIRKEGYFNKRIEANVNVNGCILCFEGLGGIKPGVADNLTKSNTMGTLVANIELKPIEFDKEVRIENIRYGLDKWEVTAESAAELDKLINILDDNPALLVSLGSHTDSQGDDAYNIKLSEKRAGAALNYILSNSAISPKRIKSSGYGETRLLNDCINGAECPRWKHAVNRRTEFTVTGKLKSDPFEKLSLEEIIEGRQQAPEVTAFKETEIVKVSDAEKIPEDLQEYISQTEKKSKEPETAKPELVSFNSALNRIPESRNFVFKQYSKGERRIYIEQPIKIIPFGPVFSVMTENFSGFSISILNSIEPLSSTYEEFQSLGQVYVNNARGKYYYTIGLFDTLMDAETFLADALAHRFKSARVIRYSDGTPYFTDP